MNVDCWLDILQLPSFCGFTSLAEFLLLTKIKWLRSMKLFFSCCLSPRPIFYTKNHLFFLFQNDNFFSFISRSIFFSTEERRAPGSWHIDTTSFLLCQKKKTTLKLVAKQQSCPDTVDGSVSYMLWPDWESFLTFFAALSRALALRSSKCNVSQHIFSAFIVSSTRKEPRERRGRTLSDSRYTYSAQLSAEWNDSTKVKVSLIPEESSSERVKRAFSFQKTNFLITSAVEIGLL